MVARESWQAISSIYFRASYMDGAIVTEFTHVTGDAVRMVDVGDKAEVRREAMAAGRIILKEETMRSIREGTAVKGNVLATARVAATLAVKNTPGIIPMCHGIPVHGILVDFDLEDHYIDAMVTVTSKGKTGVEMEALTGVSVALLTIWDMVKSAEKDRSGQYPVTRIEGIHVVRKVKGDQPDR